MKSTAGINKFSNRLDEIFEQGQPTKAQILDAYNKAVKSSLPSVEGAEEYLKHNGHIDDCYSPTAYIARMMNEFAALHAQEVAAIEMPTDREAFEQRAGLLDTIMKKERISLIDVGEALIYYDRWFRSRMEGIPKECPSSKSKDGKHLPASSDPEGNYCGLCGKDLDIKGEEKPTVAGDYSFEIGV